MNNDNPDMEIEEKYDDAIEDDENESQQDIYTTIDDMNTLQEMNIAQLHINLETGEELADILPELTEETQPNHNENLRPRPSRMNSKYGMYNMIQMGKSTQKKMDKPYVHIIMTQMSVKEGIKKFAIKYMKL